MKSASLWLVFPAALKAPAAAVGRKVMNTGVPAPGFGVLSINGVSSWCGQW